MSVDEAYFPCKLKVVRTHVLCIFLVNCEGVSRLVSELVLLYIDGAGAGRVVAYS